MMCSRIKNGVNGTWQFAINSFNGSPKTYIFDIRNSQFIIGDIGGSEQLRLVPFHVSQLKNISGAIKWLGIRGIDNTNLLLVFLFEQRTRKYYLVTMRDDGVTINVVYEHFIYVERIVELTQSFVMKDENEHLYAVISWQMGDEHPKTSLHVQRINISPQSGMITTRILMNGSVNGNWFRPFIFEETEWAMKRHEGSRNRVSRGATAHKGQTGKGETFQDSFRSGSRRWKRPIPIC
uniref:Uncharacterized protein n=1 Tax=Parascaris univalens TaxID=6257 RepID=A0A915CCK8_PARUN